MKFNKPNQKQAHVLLEGLRAFLFVVILAAVHWYISGCAHIGPQSSTSSTVKPKSGELPRQHRPELTLNHDYRLPAGQRVVSADCSLGELHILSRPTKDMLDSPQVYTYTGYKFDVNHSVIDTFTITEQ